MVNRIAYSLLNLQSFCSDIRLLLMIDQLERDRLNGDYVGSFRSVLTIGGEADPAHDSQQPGASIFIAERWKVSDGAENSFLHGIFRIGCVTGEVHRESEGRGQVWKHGAFKPPRLGACGTLHLYCFGRMTHQPHVKPTIIASRQPFPA